MSRIFHCGLEQRSPKALAAALGGRARSRRQGSRHRALEAAWAEVPPGRALDFGNPGGNLVHVQCDEIQFTKAKHVPRGIELGGLGKTERALDELRAKGIEPE